MWNVEKDPWLNPSGGTLVILDRPPDIDHFRAQLAATVATVPRLRERVVAGVGRFSPPVWRPDPEFDLDYHIRQVALPAPGTERQLLDLVAAIYQDPYDRTRPLWMFHVIDGLEGGRAALVWKIHHAVADGTGAGRLAESYLQPTRKPPDAAGRRPRRRHRRRRRRRRRGARLAVVRRGRRSGTVTHTARRQAGIARRALGEVAMWGADPLRVPATPPTASPAPCARSREQRRRRPAATATTAQRLAAVATALAPPPPRGPVLPARRGAGRGEGPRRLAERLVRHRRGQRGDRLPRRARRSAADAEHELRRQHAHRQGDRRQLVHAVPAVGAGRPDGPRRAVHARSASRCASSGAEVSGQGPDGRSGRRRQPAADVAGHGRRPVPGGPHGLRHVQPAGRQGPAVHLRRRGRGATTRSGRSPARRST